MENLPAGRCAVQENRERSRGRRLGDIDAAEVLEIGEGLYLTVGDAGVSIVHEEHGPIELPTGNYEVVRQREYSPEEVRNVFD